MGKVGHAGAAVAAALALTMTGCGGGDDDGGDGGSGASKPPEEVTGVQAGSGDRKAAAEEAGRAAAEAAGDKVDLPAQSVGILNILGSVESAQRAERTIKDAIESVGWTSTTCDAQGDPTKMASCGDSLLDRGVDAMFVLGIEPSLIKKQLQKAKDKGVPAIEFSGQVSPDPLWSGAYYPDEAGAGKLLAEHLIEKLGEVDGTAEVAVHDFPAPWASARTEQLKEMIGGTNVKIAATSVTDAANLVQGTRKTVTDQLTENPDLKGFWFAFDSAGQAGALAVDAKFKGKEFPDRPYVVTFHGDLGTQELMRQGAIDAVVDVNYDAAGWIAVDQLAEHVARDAEFDPSPAPDYNGFEIYDDAVMTKDDLPPEGEYRESENDFVTFFKTKWAAEFGTAGT